VGQLAARSELDQYESAKLLRLDPILHFVYSSFSLFFFFFASHCWLPRSIGRTPKRRQVSGVGNPHSVFRSVRRGEMRQGLWRSLGAPAAQGDAIGQRKI